jgi:hypothetical protein
LHKYISTIQSIHSHRRFLTSLLASLVTQTISEKVDVSILMFSEFKTKPTTLISIDTCLHQTWNCILLNKFSFDIMILNPRKYEKNDEVISLLNRNKCEIEKKGRMRKFVMTKKYLTVWRCVYLIIIVDFFVVRYSIIDLCFI